MIAYYSGFSDEMQGVGWGFLAGAYERPSLAARRIV
jgi:hypothetical protein